jgi:hypothetical protein
VEDNTILPLQKIELLKIQCFLMEGDNNSQVFALFTFIDRTVNKTASALLPAFNK